MTAPLDEAAIRADERAKHGERIAAAIIAIPEDDEYMRSTSKQLLNFAAYLARTTEATA